MKKKKIQRPVYRKWVNHDEGSENYLLIHPCGLMLEITFQKDSVYGDRVIVYQTSPLNPLDENVFKKHKEVCAKSDWVNAQRKVFNMVKGQLLYSKSFRHNKIEAKRNGYRSD